MNHRHALALFPILVGLPLTAQEPDSSYADRVRRLETLVAILQQQLAEQAASAVQVRSGVQVELSGHVLINGFFNNAKVNTSETPQFVAPPDPPGGPPVTHVGGTARQSRLAVHVFHPDVGGAVFNGEVDLDFFGGQLAGSRFFPLARLRRIRMDLAWPNAWIMVGQETPPIAELNPSSLAADGFPEFTGAGNLWLWLPQIRAGVGAGDALRIGIEAAAVAPTDGSAQGTFLTQPDRAERSGLPFAEGRVFVRWRGSMEGMLSAGHRRLGPDVAGRCGLAPGEPLGVRRIAGRGLRRPSARRPRGRRGGPVVRPGRRSGSYAGRLDSAQPHAVVRVGVGRWHRH